MFYCEDEDEQDINSSERERDIESSIDLCRRFVLLSGIFDRALSELVDDDKIEISEIKPFLKTLRDACSGLNVAAIKSLDLAEKEKLEILRERIEKDKQRQIRMIEAIKMEHEREMEKEREQ